MTECKLCKYPLLCCKSAEDHFTEDGKLHRIVGCDENNYIFGELLDTEEKMKVYIDETKQIFSEDK
jgi:hypothetical protein